MKRGRDGEGIGGEKVARLGLLILRERWANLWAVAWWKVLATTEAACRVDVGIDQGGPIVRRRGSARRAGMVKEAYRAQTLGQAVRGEVGEDMCKGRGVTPFGTLEAEAEALGWAIFCVCLPR